jgi:hypothetical protein
MANLNTDLSLFNAIGESRINRMSKLMGGIKLTQDFPLMKAAEISAPLFQRLRAAINLYLYSCIARYFKSEVFILCEDVLEKYPDHVKSLPNITPNGLILPKAEVCLEYNLVHKCVADIFLEFGFSQHLQSVHAPINIRLVNGQANPTLDNRPRSSTKVHSDMWAGEPANAIMVFIPLFGDAENIGVKFYEPKIFPRELIKPLDDYIKGAALIENSTEYKGAEFAKGQLIATDPFLLHQTFKNKPGLRLSIDFRFLAQEKIEADDLMNSTRLASYFSLEEWCDYGKGRFITTEALLKKFTGKDEVNDYYAAKYETRRLT